MTIIGHLSGATIPILSGYLIFYFGNVWSACISLVFNLGSWLIECLLLSKVYNRVPNLHIRHADKRDEELVVESKEYSWVVRMIRVYWKQSVLPAAFCLALAYMTVLGFDGVPMSYGKTNGLSEKILGMFRGMASVMAIFGALSYTLLERMLGVRLAGLIGLTVGVLH
jgi:hypothetical protein